MLSFTDYRKTQLRENIQGVSLRDQINGHLEILRLDLLESMKLPEQRFDSFVAEANYTEFRRVYNEQCREVVETYIELCKSEFYDQLVGLALEAAATPASNINTVRIRIAKGLSVHLQNLENSIRAAMRGSSPDAEVPPDASKSDGGTNTPTSGTPASGTPASGTPASGTPASGTPTPSATSSGATPTKPYEVPPGGSFYDDEYPRLFARQRTSGWDQPAQRGDATGTPLIWGNPFSKQGTRFTNAVSRLSRRALRPFLKVALNDPTVKMSKEHFELVENVLTESIDQAITTAFTTFKNELLKLLKSDDTWKELLSGAPGTSAPAPATVTTSTPSATPQTSASTPNAAPRPVAPVDTEEPAAAPAATPAAAPAAAPAATPAAPRMGQQLDWESPRINKAVGMIKAKFPHLVKEAEKKAKGAGPQEVNKLLGALLFRSLWGEFLTLLQDVKKAHPGKKNEPAAHHELLDAISDFDSYDEFEQIARQKETEMSHQQDVQAAKAPPAAAAAEPAAAAAEPAAAAAEPAAAAAEPAAAAAEPAAAAAEPAATAAEPAATAAEPAATAAEPAAAAAEPAAAAAEPAAAAAEPAAAAAEPAAAAAEPETKPQPAPAVKLAPLHMSQIRAKVRSNPSWKKVVQARPDLSESDLINKLAGYCQSIGKDLYGVKEWKPEDFETFLGSLEQPSLKPPEDAPMQDEPAGSTEESFSHMLNRFRQSLHKTTEMGKPVLENYWKRLLP